MIPGLLWRMLRSTDKRCLWRFATTFGWRSFRAVERFKRATARGEEGVPFLMISLTDRCNLQCSGCWVTSTGTGRTLSGNDLDGLIGEWKRKGSFFFGLLGGEPLLSPELLPVLRRHPDCYFQLFTNGLLLDESFARELRRLGNVTPLISIEGLEDESDRRRGGDHVYAGSVRALEACTRAGLITGVACSICATNFTELVNESFVQEVLRRGAHYLWYYIYRPVGPAPDPSRALTREQIQALRYFLVEQRSRVPMVLLDAYWDHQGKALCPAAVGISHHIGPGGDIELCPPLQFSGANIRDGVDALLSPALADGRRFLREQGRGCILLSDPEKLADYVQEEGVPDSSGRGTFVQELRAMTPQADHDMGDACIPERHWFYRLAKKYWFFGFGAYG